jgi:hypothetical protein
MGIQDPPKKTAFKNYIVDRGHEVEIGTGNRLWIHNMLVRVDAFGRVEANQIGE